MHKLSPICILTLTIGLSGCVALPAQDYFIQDPIAGEIHIYKDAPHKIHEYCSKMGAKWKVGERIVGCWISAQSTIALPHTTPEREKYILNHELRHARGEKHGPRLPKYIK